jgi:HlyD family type I secretion membrane fusion protein
MSDIAKVHDIEWYADVPRSIWKQTLVGLILIALCFGGFGGWALTAPLAAAIIAQGRFVATGQNKIVQHFEGGIIKEILVAEGDHVQFDQPLIRLDETAAQARERQLYLRRARLEAIAARLTSQIRNEDKISFPELISGNREDEDVALIVEGQTLNFEASRAKIRDEVVLIEQNMKALRFRAEGFSKQREATRLQLELLQQELAGKQQLLDKGLVRSTEIKSVQRAIAEATGQVGRLSAEMSETFAQIAKQEQQIRQAQNAQRQAALDELQGIQGELDAVREQSREAENVLRRATINSPVEGTVVRSYYHTAGGVIESGKGIMEIIPADVPLIIEAQVKRTEVDAVKIGQHATVRLIALNQRTTPVLEGEVFYLSADVLADTKSTSGQEFYLARVSLPARELARVRGFSPPPGMPVEVLIQTSERTFFNYITKPIADSMSRAFTED